MLVVPDGEGAAVRQEFVQRCAQPVRVGALLGRRPRGLVRHHRDVRLDEAGSEGGPVDVHEHGAVRHGVLDAPDQSRPHVLRDRGQFVARPHRQPRSRRPSRRAGHPGLRAALPRGAARGAESEGDAALVLRDPGPPSPGTERRRRTERNGKEGRAAGGGCPVVRPCRGGWLDQPASEASRRYRPPVLDAADVVDVEEEVGEDESELYAEDLTAVPCALTQVAISEFVPCPPSLLTMM
ncbi:hypothetical protein SO3561_07676 [Streptomyces olivochromogenes]|uniref:Uncharacterized protein n=1 Tax=Streptomyces olivochromogenes TaxID=1963 RepID=A0A250VPU4_STROL|nr:hypothetical protein SO3561_07676 [Streptomyces olivochromogenes]